MKGFIVYASYSAREEETIIELHGRLENGQSFVCLNKLMPYLFIRKHDLKKALPLLTKYEQEQTKTTNFEKESLIKITAKNQTELNNLYKALYIKGLITYEADIKPVPRFLIDNNIFSAVEIEGEYESSEKIDRVYRNPELKGIEFKPNLKIISIDTETDKHSDKLFCIGMYGENYRKNFLITDKKIKDKNIVICKTEEECLEKFKQELIKIDPDIIIGWNLIDFDLKFLESLFKKHKITFDLGRTNDKVSLRIESNFFRSSSVDIPGRQVLDGLNLFQDPLIQEAPTIKYAEYDTYTLEDVSQAILKEGKLIKGKARHEEIESLFKGDEKDLQDLVNYNIQDCKLVYDLLEKTQMIELAIERSQLTGMPLDRLASSIAAFDSVYIREARKRNLASPTNEFKEKEEKIKGGYVFSLKSGLYDNVLVLDFKSLYPSLLCTFNIDPSSHLKRREKSAIESPNHQFFKNDNGILPEIIFRLHNAREKAKKEKRQLASYAIKTIMNSFWGVLASPNCRYFNFDMASAITGFARWTIQTTAKKIEEKGYKTIYSDSVSGDTEIILQDKEGTVKFCDIENLFKEIKETGLENKEYDVPNDMKVLTLDQEGKSIFLPIKYVMRHKTAKKMYRVYLTNAQYIDVTEDHSLIGYVNKNKNNKLMPMERLIEIKPEEIGKDTKSLISLKKIPYRQRGIRNYPKEFYEFMGYFIGDGSFVRNKYAKENNKDYYLSLSAGMDKEEFIGKIVSPLKTLNYIKNYWISKTRNGDITLNGLQLVKPICAEMRSEEGTKRVPSWMFEEKEEAICSFLRGLFSSDGTIIIREGRPIVRFTNTNDKLIKDVRKLLFLVGISNNCFRENKPNRYLGKVSKTYSKHVVVKDVLRFKEKVGFLLKRKQERLNRLSNHSSKSTYYHLDFDLSKVKKIEEIKCPDYVYDIEVDEVHRFFANGLLVHNTDSVFIETNTDKEKALTLGQEIQDYINNYYKEYVKGLYNRNSYLELEFKKLYLSMMIPKLRTKVEEDIAAKKRYAGLVEVDGKEEVEITGLEAMRGDWTEAARQFQRELLYKLFKHEPLELFIKSYIKKIKEGKLDNQLVYRKSIRKALTEYTKTTPPHVKAARQLEVLESNIIEYYITTEGPEPIQKLKHKLDYDHYIKKQIEPIANQVLSLFNKTLEDIEKGSKQSKLF